MVRLLLANGADLEASDHDGQTPLLLAAQKGYVNEFRELVNAGADIDVEDNEKRGVESLARAAHHPKILEFIGVHRQYLKERKTESTATLP